MSHRAIVEVPGSLRAGPYSLAMQSDGIIFTSGQVGLDSDTRALVEGGFEPQARQVFRNLKIILEAAGVGFGDVLKANVFLAEILNFATLNAIYGEHFSVPYPARTTIWRCQPSARRACGNRIDRASVLSEDCESHLFSRLIPSQVLPSGFIWSRHRPGSADNLRRIGKIMDRWPLLGPTALLHAFSGRNETQQLETPPIGSADILFIIGTKQPV
jgi:2-iminobutanoate/2-iminopropanoate deaminase